MTTNKLQPIHPGEVLRNKYMKPMALSANALALRVPATRMGKPSSWRYLKRRAHKVGDRDPTRSLALLAGCTAKQ